MTIADTALRRLGGRDFLEQVYGRSHQVVDGDDTSWDGLLSWAALNDILTFHSLQPPRVRLTKAGKRVPVEAYTQPRDSPSRRGESRLQPSAVHRHLADGASLVLEHIDKLHPPIAELATGLERIFGTSVKINLYATWATSGAFRLHWDPHDVVVLQLEGTKRWRVYEPSRVAPMSLDLERPEEPPPDTPPLADVVLTSGDLLYLPRGWWHVVTPADLTRTLSLTCNLKPVTGADLLQWLSETLRGSAAIRMELPRFAAPGEQATHLEQVAKEVIAELQDPTLLQRFFAAKDGNDRGRPRFSLPHVHAVPADPRLVVRLLTPRASLRTSPDSHAVLTSGGADWTFASAVGPLLARLVEGDRRTLGELADGTALTIEQAAEVVAELVRGDVATVETP